MMIHVHQFARGVPIEEPLLGTSEWLKPLELARSAEDPLSVRPSRIRHLSGTLATLAVSMASAASQGSAIRGRLATVKTRPDMLDMRTAGDGVGNRSAALCVL